MCMWCCDAPIDYRQHNKGNSIRHYYGSQSISLSLSSLGACVCASDFYRCILCVIRFRLCAVPQFARFIQMYSSMRNIYRNKQQLSSDEIIINGGSTAVCPKLIQNHVLVCVCRLLHWRWKGIKGNSCFDHFQFLSLSLTLSVNEKNQFCVMSTTAAMAKHNTQSIVYFRVNALTTSKSSDNGVNCGRSVGET